MRKNIYYDELDPYIRGKYFSTDNKVSKHSKHSKHNDETLSEMITYNKSFQNIPAL